LLERYEHTVIENKSETKGHNEKPSEIYTMLMQAMKGENMNYAFLLFYYK